MTLSLFAKFASYIFLCNWYVLFCTTYLGDLGFHKYIHIKELIKYLNILILPQENGICKLLPIALQLFCIQLVTCHPHRYSTHFEAWKLLQIMPLIDPNCHGIEWRMLWKFSFQFLFSERGNIFIYLFRYLTVNT